MSRSAFLIDGGIQIAGNDGELQYKNGNDLGASSSLKFENGNLVITGITIVDGTQQDGYVLTSNASGVASWQSGGTGGGGTPAGSTTEIQYNDAGSFAAFSGFTFNDSTKILDIEGEIAISGTSFLRAGDNSITSTELGSGALTYGICGVSIGVLAKACANNNIAIGANSISIGAISTTIGRCAVSDGSSSVAIGNSSCSYGAQSTAIGVNTYAFGAGSTTVGAYACATGIDSIALGCNSYSTGANANAIGTLAQATGASSISIGTTSCAIDNCSIAIGNAANAIGSTSTAIGKGATATGSYSVAIGCGANLGATGIAIGRNAKSDGTFATAIGENAYAKGNCGVSIGFGAYGINCAVSIGVNSKSYAAQAVVIGTGIFASGGSTGHVAIGNNAKVYQSQTIAIGRNVCACCAATIAIGTATLTNGTSGIGIGNSAQVNAQGGISIGVSAGNNSLGCTTGTYAISMGKRANCNQNVGSSSIAIGDFSNTSGNNSISFGTQSCATGLESVALGYATEATATGAMMIGRGATSIVNVTNEESNSIAFGWDQVEPQTRFADTASQFINGSGNLIIGSGATGMTGQTGIAKLHVIGDIAIVDGTQQDGYVLTSDASGIGSWQQVPRVVSTQDISGATSIDLSTADVFILTITANVTNFTFTNEIVGREYTFIFIKNTTDKTFTWATGKYYFGFGNTPTLTDPTTNGTAPATSKDVVTAISTEAGTLDVVITNNLIAN